MFSREEANKAGLVYKTETEETSYVAIRGLARIISQRSSRWLATLLLNGKPVDFRIDSYWCRRDRDTKRAL